MYAAQGNYQIVISKMEAVGAGNILQMLEERKRKLAEEGLFNSEKKRPLPLFPQTIGVVTSPTGAAIRDILNIAKRRNPKINIIVLPALVQGDGAAQTIIKMIEIANFYTLCDVLIVGRGGGSLEDLLPFSEENVVRAVSSSKIPVISAVGHEIDWALCDYAADFRAPTPSAAAEMAIPVLEDIKIELNKSNLEIKTGSSFKVETSGNNITCKVSNKGIVLKEKNSLTNKLPQTLIIYLPNNVNYEDVNIETDAGNLNIDNIIATKLDLELGAGQNIIKNINVYEASIETGAGELRIDNGNINNGAVSMDKTNFIVKKTTFNKIISKIKFMIT